MNRANLILALALAAGAGDAQTKIDLRGQARNVDFSGAASTRPVRTGTALPGTCASGELFFKTDEKPGNNLYGCAGGSWAQLSGASVVPDPANQGGKALFTDGQNVVWSEAVKTVTPGAGLVMVCSNGNGPASGDCWVYLDELYAATQGGTNVYTGINDFSNATTLRVRSGNDLPSTCSVSEVFFRTGVPAGANWYGCTSQNTWSLLGGSGTGGGAVASVFGRTGDVTARAGDYTAGQITNAVDATSSYADPGWLSALSWGKITGKPSQFNPSAHKSSHATGGSDALAPADIGAQPAGSYEAPLTFLGPLQRTGDSIACPSCITSGTTADTDLGGSFPHLTVTKIQGRPVSNAVPGNLQFLGWNAESGQWEPKDIASAGTAGTVDWSSVINRPSAYPAAPHKSTHATGGSDALTPADIGAQPALGYTAAAEGSCPSGYVKAVGAQGVTCGAPTAGSYLLVFDGSTTTLADGSTIAWTCGSGSGAQCTTNWTPPEGVNWVRVQMWGGGAGGQGSSAGDRGGAGGSGGGFYDLECPVTPGMPTPIAVGLGGPGSANRYGAAVAGGASAFGSCVTAGGGAANDGNLLSGYPGSLGGNLAWGYLTYNGGAFNVVNDARGNFFSQVSNATRIDQGGPGGPGSSTSGTAGNRGGAAIGGGGGGGGGAYNNASGGAAGTSVLGGAGGAGGAWTSGAGYVPCANGSIPGGGGGGAGIATAGNGSYAGCTGARGEVRVYYTR